MKAVGIPTVLLEAMFLVQYYQERVLNACGHAYRYYMNKAKSGRRTSPSPSSADLKSFPPPSSRTTIEEEEEGDEGGCIIS